MSTTIQAFAKGNLAEIIAAKKKAIHQEAFSQQWGVKNQHEDHNIRITADRYKFGPMSMEKAGTRVRISDTQDEHGITVRIVQFLVPCSAGQDEGAHYLEYRPIGLKEKDAQACTIRVDHSPYSGQRIIFGYTDPDGKNALQIKDQFEADIKAFSKQFDILADELAEFDASVLGILQQEIEAKREFEDNQTRYATLLGYPKAS